MNKNKIIISAILLSLLFIGCGHKSNSGTGAVVATVRTTGGTDGNGIGPEPVNLAAAEDFVILAKSGISTVPSSAITGDMGVSPIASSAITGFSETMDVSGQYSTSSQVTGRIYASDYVAPTPANLTTAISNMETAYTDAAGRITPDFVELFSGNLGGQTLAPGLYKWSSAVTIPGDVTISGNANDVWIFQIAGSVTMDAAKNIILSGGALPENIFWQIAGAVTVGATAHFEGIILTQTAVTMGTGSSIDGRILAQTAINLQQTTVVEP